MRSGATSCFLLLGLALACGCSRQETTNCGPSPRYTTARSAPPVQIPDDLSPPNEADALRLPPDAVVTTQRRDGACLESPPAFSRDVRSGSRAQSGDEARAPAESAEPPADPGRAIDN